MAAPFTRSCACRPDAALTYGRRPGTGRYATGDEVELVSAQQADMICPPAVGEPPHAGEHSGFWMELRDEGDHVLAQRVLADPITQSVELFSPEGDISREFGPIRDSVFEVLIPAEPDAVAVALVGEPSGPAAATAEGGAGTRELARFELTSGERGAE